MLTETAIRRTKTPAKPMKLSDERGLYLLCAPSGGKWWRFKYRHAGKEKLLSLGTYPEVSLAKAREGREEARRQLAAGVDRETGRKPLAETGQPQGTPPNTPRSSAYGHRAAQPTLESAHAGLESESRA